MSISSVRHAWPEKENFYIRRPNGHTDYTFLHFFNPVYLTVNDEEVLTGANACIFYAPKTPQFFQSVGPLVHDWMHFTADASALLRQYDIEENKIFYPSLPQKITAVFREIEGEWFSTHRFREQVLSNGLERFFILFSRLCEGRTTVTVSEDTAGMLTKVRREVLLHPSHAWNVDEMAALAKMSVSHFYAGYKQVFGTSPMNDLIEARISTAKNRLLADSTPICRLALELGYANPYHFIRQFRARTGMTPAAYRRNPEVE